MRLKENMYEDEDGVVTPDAKIRVLYLWDFGVRISI
jgi:hypothetical protein